MPADVFAEVAVGEAVRLTGLPLGEPSQLTPRFLALRLLSSRCCQRANRCMAAELISCTKPIPQRSTSDPVMTESCNHATPLLGPLPTTPVGMKFSQTLLLKLLGSPGALPQSPRNMSLYWPHSPQNTEAPTGNQARLIPAFTNQVVVSLAALSLPTKPTPLWKVDVPDLRAVFLVVLVQAVGEQARRDVQDRRANLEELAVLAKVLERRAAATDHRDVAAGPATMEDAWRRSSLRRSAGYSQLPPKP